MKSIVLVGYMGCGKSTLGRKLARRMGMEYADTDALIEQQEGASVADIFHYEGEEHFRELERSVVERLLTQSEPAVISTGGGLPVWRGNMSRLNALGVTIYLKRTPEQIASRLSSFGRQRRPRLRGLNDEELLAFMTQDMAAREPYYMRAKIVLDCGDCSDEALIEKIMRFE